MFACLSSISFIFSSLLTFSFVLFYLDGLKLSNNKIIRTIQVLSFVGILLFIAIQLYNVISTIDMISYLDGKNDINLHSDVSIDKQGAKSISQGISTVGTQIGLGASITGVAMTVSKVVAKSGMPPLQKAGIV